MLVAMDDNGSRLVSRSRLKYFNKYWIDCNEIHVPQRMKLNDFDDPLTFSLASS